MMDVSGAQRHPVVDDEVGSGVQTRGDADDVGAVGLLHRTFEPSVTI